jgi:hypothetical protein
VDYFPRFKVEDRCETKPGVSFCGFMSNYKLHLGFMIARSDAAPTFISIEPGALGGRPGIVQEDLGGAPPIIFEDARIMLPFSQNAVIAGRRPADFPGAIVLREKAFGIAASLHPSNAPVITDLQSGATVQHRGEPNLYFL